MTFLFLLTAATGSWGNVPKLNLACEDPLAFRVKKPPTMIAPSPVTKPLASLFISSKNKTDVRAAVPNGIAACVRASRSPSQKRINSKNQLVFDFVPKNQLNQQIWQY
jgi:hypothetical protein